MQSGMKKAIYFLWLCLLAWLSLRWLLPVLLPFLLGAGLALGAEPGVSFLNRRLRIPRGLSAGIGVGSLFLGLCVLLMLLFTLLFRELGLLAGILPDLETAARSGLDALQSWLLMLAQEAPEGLQPVLQRNVTELFSGGTVLLDRITRYGLGLAGTLLGHVPDSALSLGTSVLSGIMISAKLPQLRRWIGQQLSAGRLRAAAQTARSIRRTASCWLTAQLKLAGVTYLLLTAGFLILRIPYGPLWALAVAAVDAFPVLGTGTVLVPWSVLCLLQKDGARAAGLLGIYTVVSLTRSALEPRLVGRQLGLDPLVTLFALYTGFRMWGLAGMLLMPLLAVTTGRLAAGIEPGRESR